MHFLVRGCTKTLTNVSEEPNKASKITGVCYTTLAHDLRLFLVASPLFEVFGLVFVQFFSFYVVFYELFSLFLHCFVNYM